MLKIKLNKEQKLFFTSDTHYMHKNICRGVTEWKDSDDKTRDFKTLEEMNETIIRNINDIVGQDDILIHFGDWSFGGIENIWNFRKKIICKNIHLFLGNHDEHIEKNHILPNVISIDPYGNNFIDGDPKQYGVLTKGDGEYPNYVEAQRLFTSVQHYSKLEVIWDLNKGGMLGKFKAVCFHFPIASWDSMNKGIVQLHGHTHLPPHQKLNAGCAIDCGLDGHPYFRPYELSEIIALTKDQPVKTLILPSDHHENSKR